MGRHENIAYAFYQARLAWSQFQDYLRCLWVRIIYAHQLFLAHDRPFAKGLGLEFGANGLIEGILPFQLFSSVLHVKPPSTFVYNVTEILQIFTPYRALYTP